MGVNITTIDYLRVSIIEIGSTIILMVVEAQGMGANIGKTPRSMLLSPRKKACGFEPSKNTASGHSSSRPGPGLTTTRT